MNISIVGFGNMARALAKGLLNDQKNHLHVASPSLPIGVNNDGIRTHYNNQAIIPNADVVILAVKPSNMRAVLDDIEPMLSNEQLVISIAAGLTFEWFDKHLSNHIALVRAIPNLSAMYGQSATPLIANKKVSSTQRLATEQIFLNSGIITWALNESDLDAFTALSGSGPAYFFAFINAIIQAGVSLGLPPTVARTFALQTAQGSVTLAENQNQSLLSLQESVTSKGGTTAEALDVFNKHNLDGIILSAMQAAYNRSKELSKLG